jgi:hypothetical protein
MAAGPVFEAAVLGQLHRLLLHRGESSRLYFWRTAAGHEVDFVLEDGPNLIPIEAKLTSNAHRTRRGFHRGVPAPVRPEGSLCRQRFPLIRESTPCRPDRFDPAVEVV